MSDGLEYNEDLRMYSYSPNSFWTIAALECYERKMKCKGCFYHEHLSSKCQMKATVLRIIREKGKPTQADIQRLMNNLYGK